MTPADRLAKTCTATAAAAGSALEWIEANPDKIKTEKSTLARALRKATLESRKLEAAVHRPMCVGVFGPSQAGKSYLISALARQRDQRLMADFDGETIDFIEKINPEGGKESTGLVTRFSMRKVATPAGMPVAVRLLSQTDIVKVLGNTFFSDCDQSEEVQPTAQSINARMDELEKRADPRPRNDLTADDLFDIQEYFEKYFPGEQGVRALGANFWPRAAELAPRLSIADRGKLFGLIWNDVEALTGLYVRLGEALAALGFAPDAFCSLAAVMPREKSIINVDTLEGIEKPSDDLVDIQGSGGARARLGRPEVTALIAELHITIKDKPWDFFDFTDLLDFPGARSRERIPAVRKFLQRERSLEGLFLRGKVGYLFDRYCAEQELTSMLLCIGPSNQEVRTLPKMVDDWIGSTHGATAEQRGPQHTALFLVLTKFDAEFEDKAGASISSEARWSARLGASLLDFFGKAHSWPHEWKPGQPFNNCFWMRNPNFKAKHILDYTEDGKEAGIRASEADRIAGFKKDFLANADVRQHFADPERCWDEAFKLNDGGISYLAGQVAPICAPEIKLRQIDGRIANQRRLIRERMSRYYVSGDLDTLLAERRAKAKTTAQRILHCIQEQKFGLLLSRMHVGHAELADAYYRVSTRPTNGGDGARATGTLKVGRSVDMKKLIADVFADEEPDDGELIAAVAAPTDQADRFAEAAIQTWIARINELTDKPSLQAYFHIPEEPMGWLVNEIIAGGLRNRLKQDIAEQTRRLTNFRSREGSALPVASAATLINRYVNYLGFATAALDQRPQVGKAPNTRPIFAPRPEPEVEIRLSEEASQHDQEYYIDWVVGYRRLVDDNVFSREDGTVDVAANSALGRILEVVQD